jgi:hypothetical protein
MAAHRHIDSPRPTKVAKRRVESTELHFSLSLYVGLIPLASQEHKVLIHLAAGAPT